MGTIAEENLLSERNKELFNRFTEILEDFLVTFEQAQPFHQ